MKKEKQEINSNELNKAQGGMSWDKQPELGVDLNAFKKRGEFDSDKTINPLDKENKINQNAKVQ